MGADGFHSLPPMPILSKAEAKMMSAELPLLTRTRWTVLLATTALEILGPLPLGKGQCKFIIIAVDYFTKWVEAEPLATITEQKIRNFVWRAIICRFGIPRALVSNNGKQFDNAKFKDFCAELGIKNYYSSPAHPQSNGQVKVTMRTLKAALKTKLEDLKANG